MRVCVCEHTPKATAKEEGAGMEKEKEDQCWRAISGQSFLHPAQSFAPSQVMKPTEEGLVFSSAFLHALARETKSVSPWKYPPGH